VRLGKRRLFTAIVQDLTERKRAEAERLERERLRVALEKEKELREVKTRFVSTLSHELRTPLAAIRLAGDMLLKFGDRATPDERLEYLDTILTQTGYLTDMVSDILHLSQTETIGLDFNPKPTSMEVFCRRVVKDMEAVSRGSHDLSFISRQRPVYAMVDEKLLYHALTNLLTNAMKYSPEGSEVRLELSRKLNTIRIRVTDYGIGIPENDQERLFEPFHRAGNVNGVNGTGLGLYIARQAVEAHKGKITVESRIGTGTTFSVFLPV
jgi:signal transduction histidine kinase